MFCYHYLGDVILTLPVLAELRRSFPSAHVTVVVSEYAAPVVENSGIVDQTIGVRKHLSRSSCADAVHFLRLSRKLNPDVIIAPSVEGASAWGAFACRGVPVVTWRSGNTLEPFWRNHAIALPRNWREPDVAARLDLLMPLGVSRPELRRPFVAVPPPIRSDMEGWLNQRGIRPNEYALIQYCDDTTDPRHWPAQGILQVARQLSDRHGLRPVLNGPLPGGDCAIPTRPELQSVHLADFDLSVLHLAALQQMARVCVGQDTGPMHLAQAVGAVTLVLFGSTDEEVYGPLPRLPSDGKQPLPFRTVRAPGTVPFRYDSVEAREQGPLAMQALRSSHVIAELEELLAETHSVCFPETTPARRFKDERFTSLNVAAVDGPESFH